MSPECGDNQLAAAEKIRRHQPASKLDVMDRDALPSIVI
jgi:hypothetical protein